MRQILRVALVVLLAAVTSVGSAWGEKKEYTDGNGVTWEYEEIEAGATCSIGPKDRSSISGFVEIPGAVGGNGESIKVVSIGTSAFEDCKGLTEVTIPSSVTKIGKQAFQRCFDLEAVNIPNSVAEIGESAFANCIGLKEVTIPGSVTRIGYGAFYSCPDLKAVAIPSSVTRIEGRTFAFCSDLEAVTISGGVTEIGSWAFEDCSGLMGVTIPSSVTKINGDAFEGCSGLKSIGVESGNERYCSEQGVLFTKGRDTLVCYPGGKPEEHYAVPSGVTKIGSSAFAGCKGLKGVSISGSVTEIGWGAFKNCSELKEVTIPRFVKEIDMYAFEDCSGLNAVYWLADASCSVFLKAFYRIASPATLYVRQGKTKDIEETWWAKEYFPVVVEGYVVTFTNSDWSWLFGEQLVMPNGTATVPTAPTKEGYIVEWQLDGKKYDFSKPVTKDITLVAVWKQNFTVTFDAKGGTPAPDAQEVVKDGTATAPTAPTKEGYTFAGWQLDGKKYDFSTPVTQDITLVAVWKKNEESTPSTPKDPETAVESVQLAGVRVLRNPVGEALELEGMERAARVEVYSVVGARVHAEALRGEPRVVIDAQGWASGVYVVRVVASDGERTLRVVK